MSSAPSIPPENSSAAEPAPLPNLGHEYGTGTKNLPPGKLVGIVLGVLVVVLGIAAFFFRATSPATGSIDDIESVDITDQNAVMVAINVSIRNDGKTEYKMRSVSAELETGSGTQTDSPAPAMDFDRYLQAFPALKVHALPRLEVQTIEVGGQRTGTIVVSFPVNAADFAKRKSLKVIISAYGESVPLILVK